VTPTDVNWMASDLTHAVVKEEFGPLLAGEAQRRGFYQAARRAFLGDGQARMDYPAYRREGLPVSSSMIESLIKEINYRVKGTEEFWNRLNGADHILHTRAAALCDDPSWQGSKTSNFAETQPPMAYQL
jgi:hypothetical protein